MGAAAIRAACAVALCAMFWAPGSGAMAQEGGAVGGPFLPDGPSADEPGSPLPGNAPPLAPPGNAFSVGTAADAVAPAAQGALLVVDQDRLYAASRFGSASRRLREADERALEEENRRIEAALEAEERGLTDRRAMLPADEFRALAAAFDARVEDIRSAQDGKAREIARRQDDDRKRFFAAAVPVLADLMGDLGAVALMDTGMVLLSLDRIDITDTAIGRIDAVLGDGGPIDAPAPGSPAPVSPAPDIPDPAAPGVAGTEALPAPGPDAALPGPAATP